jgi:hypothetical protein
MYHIEMQASMVASSTPALVAGNQRSGSLICAIMIYVVSLVSILRGELKISYLTLPFRYHGYAFGSYCGTRQT